MKKRAIEKLEPAKTKKKGQVITAQKLDDILILNVWMDKKLIGRHCINTKTYEFSQWVEESKVWYDRKFVNLLNGYGKYYRCLMSSEDSNLRFNSAKEEKLAKEDLKDVCSWREGVYDLVDYAEMLYGENRREVRERNRVKKVEEKMRKVPEEIPIGLRDWIMKKIGERKYSFRDKETNMWGCSCCRKKFTKENVKERQIIKCPNCGEQIEVVKRVSGKTYKTNVMLLQALDDDFGVARHFDVGVSWTAAGTSMYFSEAVRIMLGKNREQKPYEIFYNQESRYATWTMTGDTFIFDNKSNRSNRRILSEFLYEDGIEKALEGTQYEVWTRLFKQMAVAGTKINYNNLMGAYDNEPLINVVEYLFKGRFEKLLKETADTCSVTSGEYYGPLDLRGEAIEDIFQLTDRQKINRIRDIDGGKDELEWMRYSEENEVKIPQEALEWLVKNKIRVIDIQFINGKMSITQIMNYLKRQKTEQYKDMSYIRIIDQWKDYLSMCERLHKKINDPMIYKPRELKRRHDEAVQICEQMSQELVAEEFAERFPGAESVLKEIKEKYEYTGEEYFIKVPERLIEIVQEGKALHHCAGSSDRYFDRISQRETYICFLRKIETPEKPFYTIEVEPNGTIRQHRGYLDEEPDIELVKPFLREWQKAIKPRLNKKDMELAEISKVKRLENIEELKDFMEAI